MLRRSAQWGINENDYTYGKTKPENISDATSLEVFEVMSRNSQPVSSCGCEKI